MWWIIGIVLLLLGGWLFGWMSNAMGEPRFFRPRVLTKTFPVIVIAVVSLGLIGGGIYSLWRASSTVVLVIVGIVVVIMVRGALLSTTKSKAMRFFQTYRKLSIHRPQASQEELVRETVRLYLDGEQRGRSKAEDILHVLFEGGTKDLDDIKSIAYFVLTLEDPNAVSLDNPRQYYTETERRDKSVNQAYEKVFVKQGGVVEKPVLSKDALKKMKDLGFDADQMSNEQLDALASMENPERSHWFAQIFIYGSIGTGLLALLRLLYLDIGSVLVYGFIAVVLSFIGHRIQGRVAARKFQEASILKWSEEQRKSQEHKESPV